VRTSPSFLSINMYAFSTRCDSKKTSLIQIAERIRPTVDKYQQAFPALLEIPSKDHPYGMCWPFFTLYTHRRAPTSQIRPRIPFSDGYRNSLANKVHVGQRGEAACAYSLCVICQINSRSYKLEIPQLIHAKCQRFSAVSHLTMGSFSLTPSVRSTNMRNGFRLCEPVNGMRLCVSSRIR